MKKFILALTLICSYNSVKADTLGLGLPDYSNRTLIPITFLLNENQVISTGRNWHRIGLMRGLRDGLRNAGYNPALNGNYRVTNVTIMTKSEQGQGQIRLCILDRPNHSNSSCQVLSQYQLSNHPREFNNPRTWLTIPLFSSIRNPLNQYPIEIEVLGNVKIKNITVIVEPIQNNTPIHPIPPVVTDPIYNPPPFLIGKTVLYNSGNIQIGEDKDLGRRSTELTMHNRNTVFANYNWIDVKAIRNDAVIDRIVVNCLDLRGYRVSEDFRHRHGNSSDGYYVHQNTALSFETPRACKYIESVQIFGFSPNGLERKSDIRVILY